MRVVTTIAVFVWVAQRHLAGCDQTTEPGSGKEGISDKGHDVTVA